MKIAVWYHCVLTGERIPSEDLAIAILDEQMNALKRIGLAAAAEEIHVGINGGESDALTVCGFIPDKSIIHAHPSGQTELATMRDMQAWLSPGWAVLYHHIKGVQYPFNSGKHTWRRDMQRVAVGEWQACVEALRRGYDTVGSSWLVNPLPGQKYWAGNFWWARSEYLMTLPPLPPDEQSRRYDAEVWIGKSPAPRVLDLQPNLHIC